MTTFAAGLYVTWSSECAESDAPSSTDTIQTPFQTAINGGGVTDFPIGNAFSSLYNGIVLPSCGRAGSRPSSVLGRELVPWWEGFVTGPAATFHCSTNGGFLWEVNGVPVANGTPTIRGTGRFPPAVPTLRFAGAALAAIGGSGVSAEGVATLAYPPQAAYSGRSHFNEFVELPPDTRSGQPVALARIRAQLQAPSASFNLGTQSNGQDRVLQSCGFAAMDAAGWIYLRPEDIGNEIQQIPPEVSQNTTQHFRFYPNAFFRRTQYVDGLHVAVIDSLSITSDPQVSQPFRLIEVQFVPDNSTWLFIIDGQPICVRIAHPEGSDFRRPDEIWNGVIVPAIQNAQGPRTSLVTQTPEIFTIVIPGPAEQSGLVDKLRYMQYARMLSVNQGFGFTFTDFPQNGGVNNN